MVPNWKATPFVDSTGRKHLKFEAIHEIEIGQDIVVLVQLARIAFALEKGEWTIFLRIWGSFLYNRQELAALALIKT